MASDFAPILRSIWSDDDWRKLSVDAQHVYLLLLSHPDRNSAGVLPLTVRKWTRLSADLSSDRLRQALEELHQQSFVVVDENTEEVLVRAFIRRATVYKHIRMLANALREVSEVESDELRQALIQELSRLPRLAIPDNAKMKSEALQAQQRVDAICAGQTPPDRPGHGMGHGMDHPIAHPPVVVAGAVAVVGAGAVTSPNLENSDEKRGGSHVSNASPPLLPNRCEAHQYDVVPPKCGACKDARIAADLEEQKPRGLRLVTTQRCLIHEEPDVTYCRGCAADRKAAG